MVKLQKNPSHIGRATDSGWGEMMSSEVADETPVLVIAHAGERHVPCSGDVWDVQIQGHAVQGRTLQLGQGICVPQSHWVVGTSGLTVRPWVDHHDVACICPHPHAALLQPQDRGAHTIDIVHLSRDLRSSEFRAFPGPQNLSSLEST